MLEDRGVSAEGAGGPRSEAQRLKEQSTAAFHAAVSAEQAGAPARAEAHLETAQDAAEQSALAAAYAYLRVVVGLIAVLLAPVLVAGNAAFGGPWKGSISAYYYTRMGNVFVGALCALAVFFLSYNYRALDGFRHDRILSNLACVMALGVALFPTASDGADAHGWTRVVSDVHLLCAAILFVTLGVFSMFLFTRSAGTATPQKEERNRLYRACGAAIFVAIGLICVVNVVHTVSGLHAVFWLESVAVTAFGVSWLVKGGFLGILADHAP
jgi:hypothetical protein